MAEEEKKSSGSGVGFILPFFGVILAIWVFGGQGQGGGIFGNASSSPFRFNSLASSTASTTVSSSRSSYFSAASRNERISSPTSREIERDISSSKRELEAIKKEAAEAKLWGTISPYKDTVRLSKMSAAQTDADKEYLSITYNARTDTTVTISGWTLESTVSNTRIQIPLGVRVPRYGSPTAQPIALEAGETALIMSGESPLGVSFHENTCIGYLDEHQTFTPSLPHQCPRPKDEMASFASIPLSDDSCHEFVPRLPLCRQVASSDTSDLSSACRAFISQNLTYTGCVKNHQTDPFFYNGKWRVYLERGNDLWRNEREIIRLLDAEGKTVSVLQY